MRKRSEVRIIVDLFKLYYKSTNKLSDYSFTVTDSYEKRIRLFCDWVRELTNSELQKDYLEQYFEFQFNRHYKKRGVRGGRGEGSGIKLSWIICKKSFDEWKKIKDKKIQNYIVRKNFKSDVKVKREVKKENWDDLFLKLNSNEEMEKLVIFGEPEQLTWCEQYTFMYSDKSEICKSCDFKGICKKNLKKKYPKIYKLRGYE